MSSISPVSTQLATAGVRYAPEIASAASRHGLDPTLLAAVAAQETGGPGSNSGANIVGDGGHGHGVFQIDDRWHAFADTAAAMDPQKNADYAASMLTGLLHRFGGNVHEALSAYNAGSPNASGTTTTWADGKTLGYADSVLRHQAQIAGTSGAEPPNLTEACRADHADTFALVDALQTLQQLMQTAAPQLPPTSPVQPPQNSSADAQSALDGLIFQDGDDS